MTIALICAAVIAVTANGGPGFGLVAIVVALVVRAWWRHEAGQR